MVFLWKKRVKEKKRKVKGIAVSFLGTEKYEDNYLLYPSDIMSVEEQKEVGGNVNWHQWKEREQHTEFALFAVSDGIGGANHGEIASYVTVSKLHQYSLMLRETLPDEMETVLEHIAQSINREVYIQAEKQKEWKGMGATCAVLVLKDETVFIMNVGDSRIYQWDLDKEKLVLMTKDQTEGQRLIDMGLLNEEEAKKCPQAEGLAEYMGKQPKDGILKPQIFHYPIKGRKRYFICSDGLSNYISFEKLQNIFRREKAEGVSLELKRKVERALEEKKVLDNITWLEVWLE